MAEGSNLMDKAHRQKRRYNRTVNLLWGSRNGGYGGQRDSSLLLPLLMIVWRVLSVQRIWHKALPKEEKWMLCSAVYIHCISKSHNQWRFDRNLEAAVCVFIVMWRTLRKFYYFWKYLSREVNNCPWQYHHHY